ncbi:MAG: FKBP-type peptidyl-prolyl cis-trans isomerase [Flavisolibacter sp.]
MNWKRVVFYGLVVVWIAGCSKTSKTSSSLNCSWDSCALKAPASEVQAIRDSFRTRKNDTLNTLKQCSGIFYKLIDAGTGKRPTACSSINISYVAKLIDSLGRQFDSTSNINLPLDRLIPGLRDGVPLIREGGQILLYIPPSLGYGPYDYGPVPGNSILYFKVKLISIQ